MKISIIVVTVVLLGTLVVSAKSSSEKNNKRYDKFLVQIDSKNKFQDDEYKTYRIAQEKKITENEKKITELRLKKDKINAENRAKYESKIDEFKKRNNELRKRITLNYKNEGKEKWESFKKEFNHDMDEFGEALKDVYQDNVK
jgi:ribosomal protein L3